jgi:hypothetical protein
MNFLDMSIYAVVVHHPLSVCLGPIGTSPELRDAHYSYNESQAFASLTNQSILPRRYCSFSRWKSFAILVFIECFNLRL